MLTVHHLNDSRSQRVLWLLEELEVEYTIKKYQRNAMGLAPPELIEVIPLGKSPGITDGDVTLAESGAIVEYIISKYGKGKYEPPESGRLDNLYFTHYAEGSFMPVIIQKLLFTKAIPANVPFFIRPLANMVLGRVDKQYIQPELRKHLNFIESHLQKSKSVWFAGGPELTAADFQMAFAIEFLMTLVPAEEVGHKMQEYLKVVHSRPAYKRGIERGGEYAYA